MSQRMVPKKRLTFQKRSESLYLGLLVTQLCLILCDPMNGSPPGSSVHRISQARILEWIAISSSRESSRPRDWTHVSWISALAGSSQEVKPVPQNAIKEHCRCRKEPGTVLAVLHVDKSYIKALSETGGKGPRKCSHKKASPPPSTPSPICKQKKESL